MIWLNQNVKLQFWQLKNSKIVYNIFTLIFYHYYVLILFLFLSHVVVAGVCRKLSDSIVWMSSEQPSPVPKDLYPVHRLCKEVEPPPVSIQEVWCLARFQLFGSGRESNILLYILVIHLCDFGWCLKLSILFIKKVFVLLNQLIVITVLKVRSLFLLWLLISWIWSLVMIYHWI